MTNLDLHYQRLEDLFVFAKDILGYNKLSRLHLEWFDALLKYQNILLVTPPGHYKTSACTISYPLFRLTEDHNMRILIVNETMDTAKTFLSEIKGHIQQNERFRQRYGNWNTTARYWTEERILIPRTMIRKEPSIAVASVLGSVVSIHPNLIVVDDPISGRNSETPQQRQKVITWFKRNLLPRRDKHETQTVVISPRWAKDDLPGFIMSDPGYAHWKVINMAAEWYDEENNHQILLPEKFTKKDLNEIREEMGTKDYTMIYLSDPSGHEGSDFKLAWIDSARYDKVPDEVTVFAGIDLAISKNSKAAFFAYIVIGIDKKGDIYVIDGYRDKIPFYQQLNTAKRIRRIHDPAMIIVETNAYQAAFTESLSTDPETRNLRLRAMPSKHDKDAKIRGLAPLFERGVIRLPRNGPEWVEHLIEELIQFPDGKKDMLDALWMAWQGIELRKNESRFYFTDDVPEPNLVRRGSSESTMMAV